jgi:DNA (cytosine-5)-methyltransferase 1
MKAMGKRPSKPSKVVSRIDATLLELDMSAAAKRFGVKHDVIAQRLRKPSKPLLAENKTASLEFSQSDAEYVTEES